MKTTVFLTGATGTMGWAGLQEILRYPEQYNLRVLARPSAKNKEKLSPYMQQLEVIWGDLTRYDDVLKGVTGADIVLHVGGMVSPQADYRPNATRRTNLTAALNVRDAVLAQPEDKQPKVVYIGSVAQMGDRREPLHWGRAGDPICVSAYDHYGLTKAMAERIITGSPIRRWVSLRQSGILYPAILKNYDPIMFHVPIRGVLEWATVEDSGRLLERVCRPEVPEDFWKRYYNIGSGAEYRLSNYEFEKLLLETIGCPRPEQIFSAHWFTTRNFHGMWYIDGDVLENYLHFRANVPVREYFKQMAEADTIPAGIRFAAKTHIAKLFPHIVKIAMYAMAMKEEHGTQWWIRHNKEQRIHAYYGSIEAYRAIPDWKHMDLSHNSETYTLMDHGYDEQKPMEQFTIEDMQKAAAFRGGRCLSETMTQGDWDTPLVWECAEGHQFTASPRLILLGGHWCPECFPYPYTEEKALSHSDLPNHTIAWHWDKVARKNPFFAQLWAPLHDADENNVYGPEVFEGWEK
ncbi:MAG: NAD-dependent epimerase/dehydratase family protein [Paludibacteraceae bacterium]|nr:NAD-dependent epimerase/dehydratase family protein [Paludibacteraceae bacterium]